MNQNYPRNNGLKTPGFAAGTCLRKDFGMINECFPQTDLLLQAYKINEYMPKFYVDLIGDKFRGKKIGIFGYTFKSDTDDTRDSLVPKMIRYIERHVPREIKIHEPNLPIGYYDDKFNNFNFLNKEFNEVFYDSEIIFIAINHNVFVHEFLNKDFSYKILIDIWNILNTNRLLNDWSNQNCLE
jgi:UDP-N-acetyl-D-mannosaminuronic acid dehydrogenase